MDWRHLFRIRRYGQDKHGFRKDHYGQSDANSYADSPANEYTIAHSHPDAGTSDGYTGTTDRHAGAADGYTSAANRYAGTNYGSGECHI